MQFNLFPLQVNQSQIYFHDCSPEVNTSTKPVKLLKGVNGQLEVFPDRLVIKRKGAMAKLTQGFFKGDKTIYVRQITGIQVKRGGLATNGYIQFSLGGGVESTKGILDATHDENTVMFKRKHNKLVEEIKAYIEQAMSQPLQPTATVSVADEIRKLQQLYDDGILTKDEFEAQKARLLSK